METVIGIDPSLTGSAVCGLARSGTYRVKVYGSKPAKTLSARMCRYGSLVDDLTEGILWRRPPELVLIEGYSFGSRGASVLNLAEFGGLLRAKLMELCDDVREVPPTVLKKFVTGKGNADKIKMAVAVVKQWEQEFATDDECDAYCLARMGAVVLGWEKCNKAQKSVIDKWEKDRA